MKKDAFYFSHDTNAHSDPKIMLLLSETGLAGLGMYWIIIEILHQEPEGKISVSAFKNYIKFYCKINCTTDFEMNKIEQVLNTTGLLLIEDDQVFSNRVFANKNIRENISLKRQMAGKASAEARKNGTVNQLDRTNAQQISTLVEQTATKERKRKESKVKEIKENTILSFGNDEPSYNEFLKTLDPSDTKDLYSKLKEFIYEKKPKQPEPYVDFWNLYADKYNLAKVKMITDLRKSKLKTRVTEPTFDFPEIMLKISKDDFLKGGKGGWQVTFDHVIESQNNYAKILERK